VHINFFLYFQSIFPCLRFADLAATLTVAPVLTAPIINTQLLLLDYIICS
jgi:hypothetical protein